MARTRPIARDNEVYGRIGLFRFRGRRQRKMQRRCRMAALSTFVHPRFTIWGVNVFQKLRRWVSKAEHSPDPSDSDCEDNTVRLSFELPTVILAAHDGAKLDLPMLLFECRRHGCKWEQSFEDWLFVDTLSIVQSLVADLGGCAQLQCLVPPRIQHPLPMSRRRRAVGAPKARRQWP